jgi:thiol-disulfide isomerase/thioredoxin
MKTRWAIAIGAVVALAAVTVTIQMPWLFEPGPRMERVATTEGTPSGSKLSCPVDAKPANLDFTIKDHTGAEVSLSSFKGKVLLINFWATWCGPCKVEIPHFVEFQERYGAEGLQLVGISVDDTAEKMAPYVRDLKMNYPVLQGLSRDDVQDAYGPIVGIPVSVLISRDGKICARHTGLTSKDVFESEIKALL